jgi:hypothetical protein
MLTVMAVPLVLAQGAGAAPVPPGDFTCGVTVFTACNQTAHFSTPSGTSAPEVGVPSPQATGCPAFVAVDAPVIQGTGNGIEHAIINDAPDPSAPILTGHLQQWFGGSFNHSNFVVHDTINFSGTAADGTPFSFHAVDHVSTTPNVAAAPNSFDIAHC